MYISLKSQELNTCERIGYEYFCKGLFVVKSKHKFSCTSAVYFNLNHEIKQNCDFEYHPSHPYVLLDRNILCNCDI